MHTFSLPVPDGELFPAALRAARGDRAVADSALQHLRVQVWRGKYDPARPFRRWAAAVLWNYCRDDRRGHGRALGGTDSLLDRADTRADRTSTDTALDLSAPFCPADVGVVRQWKPRTRLVLLGWYGLWAKLPHADRDGTLAALDPAAPFPVPDFNAWADRDRTHYLAQVLRCPPNTVTQLRLREADRLTALRFVRELQV